MRVYIQKGTVEIEVFDSFDNVGEPAVNKRELEDGWELVSPACGDQNWIVLAQGEQDGPNCRLRRQVTLWKENIALHFREPPQIFEGLTWIPGFIVRAYKEGVNPIAVLREMGIGVDYQ